MSAYLLDRFDITVLIIF